MTKYNPHYQTLFVAQLCSDKLKLVGNQSKYLRLSSCLIIRNQQTGCHPDTIERYTSNVSTKLRGLGKWVAKYRVSLAGISTISLMRNSSTQLSIPNQFPNRHHWVAVGVFHYQILSNVQLAN